MNKIRKLIALTSLLVALGSLVPLVLSATPADITASVTVEKSCGINVNTTAITFQKVGNLNDNPAPGDTSDPETRGVTNTGTSSQTECTYDIKGTAWTGGPGMDVKQTGYKCTDTSDNACTATGFTELTTSDVPFLGLDAGITTPVDLHVKIPLNQPSGIYSQTITITLVDPP